MALNSIGDLSQGSGLRRQTNVIKQQMQRLAYEVSTGITSDVTKKLGGNFVQIADVEHKLVILESQRLGAEQGRVEADLMQTALERLQTETQSLGSTAITVGSSTGAPSYASFANEAQQSLGSMISSLNTNIGGRSLFAGDEVNTRAIAPLDEFMSAIRSAAAGSASLADLNTAMDTFFDTPGGDFETLIYNGGTDARASLPLGEGETVTLDLRADDPAIRRILKETAIAALIDDPGISLTTLDRVELTRQVGERLLGGQDRLTDIRSDLGFAESRIDRAATRISAEMSGLSMVRTELLGVDQYEAATELEAVQIQLETIYTITSRMSRLNLVNFLS